MRRPELRGGSPAGSPLPLFSVLPTLSPLVEAATEVMSLAWARLTSRTTLRMGPIKLRLHCSEETLPYKA